MIGKVEHSLLVSKRLNRFEYFAPTTLPDALSLFERHGGEAVFLAGGTDVLPMMKFRALVPGFVISLKRIPDLNYIREDAYGLHIGALATIDEINNNGLIKQSALALHESSNVFAAPQVRNMATIGGNICRSSPAADTVPVLMALDAEVRLNGINKERRMLLVDFYKGGKKNALNKEILTEITIPTPKGSWGAAFMKLERNTSDLSKVNGAVRISMRGKYCEDIRIVLGAVADRVIRLPDAEDIARGKILDGQLIEEVARVAVKDITPITDARSTAAYRKNVSTVVVRRLIAEAIARSHAHPDAR